MRFQFIDSLTLLVSRVSIFGEQRSMTLNLHGRTLDDFMAGIERWNKGESIQKVLGFLSDSEREFLISGILPDEWDNMFPEEEE